MNHNIPALTTDEKKCIDALNKSVTGRRELFLLYKDYLKTSDRSRMFNYIYYVLSFEEISECNVNNVSIYTIIDNLIKNIEKDIEKISRQSTVTCITVTHEHDEYPSLDHLGSFSNTQGDHPIKHNGARDTYPYFNADNVENMEQARQNYKHRMEYENSQTWDICIRASAEIVTNGLCNIISSGGLYEINCDSDKDYIKTVQEEQLEELKSCLNSLNCVGFENIVVNYDYSL